MVFFWGVILLSKKNYEFGVNSEVAMRKDGWKTIQSFRCFLLGQFWADFSGANHWLLGC